MVRQIPLEQHRRVVELWLEGHSYRVISTKMGISLGAIASIISDERKKAPVMEELRDLKVALTQANAALLDAIRGASFLEKLNYLNIQIDLIPDCISLLDQYGEKAGEVLKSGIRLKELEVSQRKTYEHIVTDAHEMVKDLREMAQRLEDLRVQERTIKKCLHNLEQLKTLFDKMNRYGLTLVRLDLFIEQTIRLEGLGFTLKAAEILASELARRSLDPEKSAITLAKLLSEHGGLEEVVAKLLAERSKLQHEIEAKMVEVDGLMRQKEALLSQLEALKRQVDEYEDITRRQEQILGVRLKQLEEEYAVEHKKLEALHSERLQKLNREYGMKKASLEEDIKSLEGRRNEIAKDIQELQNEHVATQASIGDAEKALKEIGERVAEKRPLAALTSIIEEPKAPIEPATLLTVILDIVEGLKIHLTANPKIVSSPQKLDAQLEELSRTLTGEFIFGARKAR